MSFSRAISGAEQALNALAPAHQYRADTVTLSGGNVATIPNRRGAGSLVMTAGTLAAPAGSASLGGAQALTFTGAQYLDSNEGVAAFKGGNDGTGFEIFVVHRPLAAATTLYLHSTLRAQDATTQTGFVVACRTSGTPGSFCRVARAGSPVCVEADNATAMAVGAATYQDFCYSETAAPEYVSFGQAAVLASGSSAAAPNTGNPSFTLRLGANAQTADNPYQGEWAETIIFWRVLSEYERQQVREYIAARYRIAAPVWTGPERDVLSMVPFSWPRADKYLTAASKVTAWLDQGRPGHSFAQSNGGLQGATPAVDAGFAGQLVATYAGASYYDSNAPAAAWGFANSGTGFTTFTVFQPTSNASKTVLMASRFNGVGILHNRLANTAVEGFVTTAIPVVSGGVATLNVPTYSSFSYGTASSPQYDLRLKSATVASGVQSGAPIVSAPQITMRLGHDGITASNMLWAESLWFTRVLSASEHARVQAYLLARYGITP